MSAYVLLEDGTRFDGEAVGAPVSVTGEVVFTTGMSGYQESMTDPSFARQLITFTTAHVGNYGVSEAAMESDRIHAAGAIMRAAVDYDDAPGAEQGWLSWLRDNGIPGIHGVDTRALVRHIRSAGAMRGGIFAGRRAGQRGARAHRRRAEHGRPRPRARGDDRRRRGSTKARRRPAHRRARHRASSARSSATSPSAARRSRSTRARRPPRSCWRRDPDGFFLVPGPGDPAALDYIVENIRTLLTHQAGVRHLPRPPAALARRGPGDVQAPVRPPRRQPPGQGPPDRPDRDHVARTTASRSRASPARSSSPSSARLSSPT